MIGQVATLIAANPKATTSPSYLPQLIITVGATIVSLASMTVTLWTAREQRRGEIKMKEFEDAVAARRKQIDFIDAQIAATEALRVRVSEVSALIKLRAAKPAIASLRDRCGAAVSRLDDAIDTFIGGWASIRSGLRPNPISAVEYARLRCTNALDNVVSSVLVASDRKDVNDELALELASHAASFDALALDLISEVMAHRSTALASSARPS